MAGALPWCLTARRPFDEQRGVCQRSRGRVQGSGRQVNLRLSRCMHDAARESSDAPGRSGPYPNTGYASDTTEGSQTVQISGKEVMLKNKSYFKQSTGDEAGAAAKKGVVTSTNRGKVYFIAWSSDVKFEGENAVRHLDMTTHNTRRQRPTRGRP